MPIVVDHAERRRYVIDIASRVLAKSGLRGVTVRSVARAAGCSTAVVSHYFKNKDELLTLIFRHNISDTAARGDAALAASGGDLRAYLVENMALDDHRLDNWRIWHAYIAQLLSHPDIVVIQKETVVERLEQWTAILESMNARGLLKPGLNLRVIAERLLSMIQGLAVQVLFDIDAWPPERQHAVLDSELRTIYKSYHPE
jgi:AcrR family transcriptional regulator